MSHVQINCLAYDWKYEKFDEFHAVCQRESTFHFRPQVQDVWWISQKLVSWVMPYDSWGSYELVWGQIQYHQG